jgi:hypothetical protein
MVRQIRTGLWVLAVCAQACADLEVGTHSGAVETDPPCPDWGCGTNTASVNGNLFFHELSTCGHENAAGLRLVDAVKHVGPFPMHVQISVVGDELVGNVGTSVLMGADLVSTTLVLDAPTGAVWIDIAAAGSIDYWVRPGRRVPTYTLKWRSSAPGAPPRALCGRPSEDMDDRTDGSGGNAGLAFIFAGDRYDAAHKTVQSDSVASSASTCWFNVVCAGSAAAKLHLLRHTTAGSDENHRTTQSQRQAMLKMITDDICGTGESFTVNGDRVYYEDMRRWHPFPAAPSSIEALWSDRGALCLDVPRRQAEDPSATSRIRSACAAVGHDLPACPVTTSNYDTWPELAQLGGLGYGLSANPRRIP